MSSDFDVKPFQILSLSGGGYKGLYTAKFIDYVEEHTGKPIGVHFDLICGTSVGGILALALATREIKASTIVEKLQEFGPILFTEIELPGFWGSPERLPRKYIDRKAYEMFGFTLDRGIAKAKHDNTALKQGLEQIFQDLKVEDLKTRVLIPAANWTKGKPQFFKTPHNSKIMVDPKRRLVDVAMATSAAPIYLPNYEIDSQVFVDGGLVGNAPGIFGVHEAEHLIDDDIDINNIRLLAVGALSSRTTANQSEDLDRGIAQWGGKIFDFMIACQEQTSHFMLQHKMGDQYYMIDEHVSTEQDKVISLDKANKGATKTLLGLAQATFQKEIGEEGLWKFMGNAAPELDFRSQREAV
ncbi:CBASS cGAMP-activated phospholipase [Thiohalobacter thiocyanaticus]|uniref:CBASS cGAMP-activated phospholipase n=1 Tax=Thiohalobacter thiocyanaticus TaxID=585455 RepID=UPI00131A2964|nr:CBASS cGAMP-activated phospholipase [Thiohalobacter thiocyanaticus]